MKHMLDEELTGHLMVLPLSRRCMSCVPKVFNAIQVALLAISNAAMHAATSSHHFCHSCWSDADCSGMAACPPIAFALGSQVIVL